MKRMLGGYKYNDQFLLELGNPFYRNHFYRTWQSERYTKVFIDWPVAVREGRLSKEFVDEMRDEALFDILYECKFPDEDAIDENGFRALVVSALFESILVDTQIDSEKGDLLLGVDIGGGGDESAFVVRSTDCAWLESSFRSDDTMTNVTECKKIMDKYSITPDRVFIDDIGIGRGVSDRLKELGCDVHGVSVGDRAVDDPDFKFYNLKAQNYWRTANWLKSGGKLVKESKAQWQQILDIRYKITSEKVIQMESKQDLKKRLRRSPDHVEALMLTFTKPPKSAEFFTV
jgi:hypothetical protein